MNYVYFMKSLRNGKVYVGRTTNKPDKRVLEHNNGSNVWSRHNKPFELIYFEEYYCEIDCAKREAFYKTGIGKKVKKAIIETFITE
ncbi:MAG: GIY-YIG nuclease family protein [Patescibacteria group bacterium]